MDRILIVLLAAWAGSLWTICAVVAPSLFKWIPERSAAGALAGSFFTLATWLGLALGLAAFFAQERTASRGSKLWGRALSIAAMLAPALSEFGLRRLMDAARASGDMARFGLLHGVSALLFAIACVCLLLALWRAAGSRG